MVDRIDTVEMVHMLNALLVKIETILDSGDVVDPNIKGLAQEMRQVLNGEAPDLAPLVIALAAAG